jgi:hypothetical protein
LGASGGASLGLVEPNVVLAEVLESAGADAVFPPNPKVGDGWNRGEWVDQIQCRRRLQRKEALVDSLQMILLSWGRRILSRELVLIFRGREGPENGPVGFESLADFAPNPAELEAPKDGFASVADLPKDPNMEGQELSEQRFNTKSPTATTRSTEASRSWFGSSIRSRLGTTKTYTD